MNARKGRTKQAKFNDLQKRFRFFLEHAGYSTPPGRAVCALNLARAEYGAEKRGIVFIWRPEEGCYEDFLGDHAYWCKEARREEHDGGSYQHAHTHDVECCVAVIPCPQHGADCKHAVALESLRGIIDADSTYRRVVEAELAGEAATYGFKR